MIIDQATQVSHVAGDTQPEDARRQSPDNDAPQVNFWDVIQTLKRETKTILSVALSCLLVAAITAFLIPVKYSSVASFVPPTASSSSSAAAIAGQLSALGPASLLGGVKSSGELYAGILRSRSIAMKLIDQFNLKQVYGLKHDSDAIKRLASRTSIVVGQKDSIIALTVSDRSPQRAHDLANAYLDALRETNGRLALTESSQRRLFFDQQLAKEKNDLADAEVELKKSQEQSGLIAPSGQTALEIETIAKTRAQIASRQIELADLRQSSTDQNPEVIRLRSVIADLEGQLARLQNGSLDNETGSIPASKVPAVQLIYVRRAREVKYHEALFEMIARQDEAARMDEARDAPLLQVLDAASYPDQKSWPPRTLIILGGLVLGLLGGCAWVFARDYMQPVRTIFVSTRTLAEKVASR